jgi:hypothetical protein
LYPKASTKRKTNPEIGVPSTRGNNYVRVAARLTAFGSADDIRQDALRGRLL